MKQILIDRAVVEQALHVATGAGYPLALIAALKAALAEPVQALGFWGRVAARQATRIKRLETTGRQALEALEVTRRACFAESTLNKADAAMEALRAALAEDALQRLTDVNQEIEAALAEPCPCGDRPAAQCPGEWEPGCDLGNNPEYARRVQEPVAWRLENDAFDYGITSYDKEQADAHIKQGWSLIETLYGSPLPQRKPLSEEELEVLAKKHNGIFYDCDINFARAIEAAHGIKEGT